MQYYTSFLYIYIYIYFTHLINMDTCRVKKNVYCDDSLKKIFSINHGLEWNLYTFFFLFWKIGIILDLHSILNIFIAHPIIG